MEHETPPQRALGAFLRAHRERLAPPKAGGRRRTPGLRREELAEACGLSATWITWLEQGREVSASPEALARLAEGLRLTAAERASLFDLAGKRDPMDPAQVAVDLPAQVLVLPTLLKVPAYLLDHAWTARAWNAAAARLFVGWLDPGASERNLMRYVFLSPKAKRLLGDWEPRARRIAAEFLADFNRRPRDAALLVLVDDLAHDSDAFRSFWRSQEVKHREGGARAFRHPVDGTRRYEQSTLIVAAHPECKLVCLVPEGSPRGRRAKTRSRLRAE